ncbi:hypothetical protein ABM000_02200 [Morganella morganii]|uniref:hypothetical protein n=1 Tax=Morganella morganii TaxID=582 RepID=UPI002023AE65|nr:hypothetical protein [Morganella morganii]
MTTEAAIQVRYPKMMLSVLMAGTFTGLFGETALNMALTNLMSQFSLSAGQAQWLGDRLSADPGGVCAGIGVSGALV